MCGFRLRFLAGPGAFQSFRPIPAGGACLVPGTARIADGGNSGVFDPLSFPRFLAARLLLREGFGCYSRSRDRVVVVPDTGIRSDAWILARSAALDALLAAL